MTATSASRKDARRERFQRFSAASVRAFHVYANWLVGISWRRFILLSLITLAVAGILHDMPPFTWTITEHIDDVRSPRVPRLPAPPAAVVGPAKPVDPADKPPGSDGVQIDIDKNGIRITPQKAAVAAAAAGSAAARAADAASAVASA
ncbi:MAG: hypothetical protein M3Y32_14600, partial [Pseudomonadota bacterium]|nr:hypothetical protein [Pseudomonadota bacterium]